MSKLTARTARVVRAATLGAVVVSVQLGGCASTHLAPAADVRVIHTDKYHNEDPDPRGASQEVPNADFVEAINIVHGAFRSLEAAAREFAALKDADIVLIRPSVPYRQGTSRTRVEAWRTRGTRVAFDEEPGLPGITLVPPAGTSIGKRHHNIIECFAEARAGARRGLSEGDNRLLAGNDTSGFILGGFPLIDRYERPTKSGFTYRKVRDSGPASTDVYVLCFIKRGYQWPQR